MLSPSLYTVYALLGFCVKNDIVKSHGPINYVSEVINYDKDDNRIDNDRSDSDNNDSHDNNNDRNNDNNDNSYNGVHSNSNIRRTKWTLHSQNQMLEFATLLIHSLSRITLRSMISVFFRLSFKTLRKSLGKQWYNTTNGALNSSPGIYMYGKSFILYRRNG